ncbi:MAG: aminopeptidase P family protein [Thermomicrobiales bacterium]|nr:aminopeptidase P family protein [Thermomicrobiales bacterium]
MGQIERPEAAWYGEGDHRQRRLTALRENGLDALLALTPENAEYLSGRASTIATLWRTPALVAVAVNTADDVVASTGDNEFAALDPELAGRFAHPLWIEHLDLRTVPPGPLAQRVAAARADGDLGRPSQFDPSAMLDAAAAAVRVAVPAGGRVGTELAMLPVWVEDGLRLRLPGIDFVEADPIFAALRAIKDPVEIARLRLAAELTEIGIAAVRDALRPGMSVVGVSAAYQTAIWRHAADDERFAALRDVEGLPTIGDGSGPTQVEPGQTVKLDMQVDIGGYHSDLGRTYALEPTADQQAAHAALLAALDAVTAAARPGVTFHTLWEIGIGSMREAGFANYSRGHLGHSVGLAQNYEEPPFVAADETRPLAPGMVLSLEVPWYLLGVGAFQLERMVLITASGHERLDTLPDDLAVVRS